MMGIYDMRLTIYERRVRVMAAEDSDAPVRVALLRVTDPRSELKKNSE